MNSDLQEAGPYRSCGQTAYPCLTKILPFLENFALHRILPPKTKNDEITPPPCEEKFSPYLTKILGYGPGKKVIRLLFSKAEVL